MSRSHTATNLALAQVTLIELKKDPSTPATVLINDLNSPMNSKSSFKRDYT
jgi:hypothetical protein